MYEGEICVGRNVCGAKCVNPNFHYKRIVWGGKSVNTQEHIPIFYGS